MDGSIAPEPDDEPSPPQEQARSTPDSGVSKRRDRNQGLQPQSRFMETVEWYGLALARLMFAPFSPQGRSRSVGWLARNVGPYLWLSKRIDENIDLVRPQYDAAKRWAIRRGVMDNFARTASEYLDLQDLAARSAQFPVKGVENLQAALATNGGRLVVVSAHYGNWEAVRAVAARQGAPLGIIYRAFNNRRIDDYAFRQITACGWPAFRKGAEGSKALFRHVRGGGGAMILVDQRAGGAPSLDFMGEPAETSLAAAQLALKLKAPLLPAAARRTSEGFEVVFEPPVAPSDPLTMSQEVNRIVGEWVDAAPEQWFWLHRRWRRRGWGGNLRTYGRDRDSEQESDDQA